MLKNEFQIADEMMDRSNANMYHVNRKGYNLLHLCVMSKNLDAIDYLIKHWFDPHREEYYDEHDGCDFVVKFGLLNKFRNNYFTKNCKLHNKRLRSACPIKPKPINGDIIDEKVYNEKSDRDKLFENLERLEVSLKDSVLGEPFKDKHKTREQLKEEDDEENNVMGWDVQDIAVSFSNVQDTIDSMHAQN